MWEKIQKDFKINENFIWLNNCGISVMNRAVEDALQGYIHEFAASSVKNQNYGPGKLRSQITSILASLFKVQENEFALVQNTAEALNYIAYGLDYKTGDEILLLEKEYPSNVYPWRSQEKRHGIKVKFIPDSRTEQEFLTALNSSITEHTKVISLSAVHWLSGMRYPLHEVGKICKEKNILFCLDAAQGAGHVDIFPAEMNISFMAFSAWKWLMGPLGMGVLYIDESAMHHLQPNLLSTGSVVNDSEYLPYRETYKPGAARYEISTSNYLAWVYFAAILQYLQKIEFPIVQSRIYTLASFLHDQLASRNFTGALPNYGATGILNISHPEVDSQKLWLELNKENIVCALRGDGVRFAPHIFNSENQLEQVATKIDSLMHSGAVSK